MTLKTIHKATRMFKCMELTGVCHVSDRNVTVIGLNDYDSQNYVITAQRIQASFYMLNWIIIDTKRSFGNLQTKTPSSLKTMYYLPNGYLNTLCSRVI